jgi:hypothetical protein
MLITLFLTFRVSTETFTTFYVKDCMTVHRDRFPVNKTNRCTEFQFYWYYDSTCFRHRVTTQLQLIIIIIIIIIMSILRNFLAIHQHWYNLCSLVTECWLESGDSSNSRHTTSKPHTRPVTNPQKVPCTTFCNVMCSFELLMMGITVAKTCWANYKFNKLLCCI